MTKEAPRPSVYDKNGKPNEQVIFERYGLRVADISDRTGNLRRLAFTSPATGKEYNATILDAFEDRRCPLGEQVEKARQKGADALVQTLGALGVFFEGFNVTPSEETLERLRHEKPQTPTQPQEKKIEERAEAPEKSTAHQEQATLTETVAQSKSLGINSVTGQTVIDALEQPQVLVPLRVEEPVKVAEKPRETAPSPAVEAKAAPSERVLPLALDAIILPLPISPLAEVGRRREDHQKPEQKKEVVANNKSSEGVSSGSDTLVDQKKQGPKPLEKQRQQRNAQSEKVATEQPITKEVAIKRVLLAIDALLQKDTPTTTEKPASDEKRTIAIIQHEGTITLGARDEEAHNARVDTPEAKPLRPLSTADELLQLLDVLNTLTLEDIFPTKEGLAHNGLSEVGGDIFPEMSMSVPEGQDKKKAPLTLLVSEDILDFLKNGKTVFEQTDEEKNQPDGKSLKPVQLRNPVRILSEEREIVIELETLKKLIELIKLRKQMKGQYEAQENMTILEELGLHGLSYQNYADDMPFWQVYEAMVISLASADDSQLPTYAGSLPFLAQ